MYVHVGYVRMKIPGRRRNSIFSCHTQHLHLSSFEYRILNDLTFDTLWLTLGRFIFFSNPI